MTEAPDRTRPEHGAVLAAAGLAYRSAPGAALLQGLLAVVGGLVPVAVGLLTKQVVDSLAAHGGGMAATVVGLALGLAAAGVVSAVLPQALAHVEAAWGRAVVLSAQEQLYAAVNRMPGLGRLEEPSFRDHLRLADEASRTAPLSVAAGGLELLRGALTVAGFTVTLLALNTWMVVAIVFVAVPTAIAEFRLARQRADAMWRLSPAARRQLFYADLLTGLEAAKEVRLFGLSELFGGRMLRELRSINAEHRRLDRRELAAQLGLALLGAVAAGGGLVWAVAAARAGRLSIGEVTIFIAAAAAVQAAVTSMIGRLAQIRQAVLLFGHYRAVVTAVPDLPQATEPLAVPPLRRGILLEDVWFRYSPEHPWILRGVTMHIPHGATVGLVGLNGAGKSTIVKLLVRFYDPTAGRILWDGVDLRELCLTELRDRIGATFQDFMTYELSAGENIGVGDLTAMARPDRIREAARRAGVHEVVSALPRGYDTTLTRIFVDQDDGVDDAGGVLLSGGQWQRIALARSFLRADRDLLILDEPSSGLDAEAEADLHARLAGLRTGRTTLLITHRLGTVRSADLIVVLGDGRVVEQGPHEDLLAGEGTYARLFGLQAAGYQSAPA